MSRSPNPARIASVTLWPFERDTAGAVRSTTLPLEVITLYHGNFRPAAPSATTFLNIYEGDPNAGGTFIGSSENSVDTRSLRYRDAMAWSLRMYTGTQ